MYKQKNQSDIDAVISFNKSPNCEVGGAQSVGNVHVFPLLKLQFLAYIKFGQVYGKFHFHESKTNYIYMSVGIFSSAMYHFFAPCY